MSSIAPVLGTSASPFAAVPRVARTRLRLTRRGRFVLLLLVALPLVLAAIGFGLNGGNAVASGSAADREFEYVTVASGESLWSIAEAVAPNADPRVVVSELMAFNSLASPQLQAGEQIAIPFSYLP